MKKLVVINFDIKVSKCLNALKIWYNTQSFTCAKCFLLSRFHLGWDNSIIHLDWLTSVFHVAHFTNRFINQLHMYIVIPAHVCMHFTNKNIHIHQYIYIYTDVYLAKAYLMKKNLLSKNNYMASIIFLHPYTTQQKFKFWRIWNKYSII